MINTEYIDENNSNYPLNLKKLRGHPKKLYYMGNVKLLNEPSITVVGTRHISDYGKRITKKIVNDLALRDIVITSGMAIGTDTAAHEGTILNNGKTIAVMGTGFNHIYPKENIDLFHKILDNNGLIITEYEDNVEKLPENFPKRNRILAGLSECTLVIEASIMSGTSITVRYAKKYNKPIFALPGRIDNKYSLGTNRLIQNGTAKMILSSSDIVNGIPTFKNMTKKIVLSNNIIKEEYRKIYKYLNDEPKSIDEIANLTNNSARSILNILSLMELDDLVISVPGGGYIRKYEKE